MNHLKLEKHTTAGAKMFSVLSNYFLSAGLKISGFFSIYTDGVKITTLVDMQNQSQN